MQKEVVGVGPLKLFVRVCCFGSIATRESGLQVEVTEVISVIRGAVVHMTKRTVWFKHIFYFLT